jgi:TolB-like protein
VLSFSSNWQELSAYVMDELNNAIVRNGSLTVVDRRQLELARQEMNFGMSGEVSDESAQRIGQFLGAQAVMTGSFAVIGNTYRFRMQVITVETGVVQYSSSLMIVRDEVLKALMNGGGASNSGLSDFGKRLGYGFLNPLFGLGSYLQGDSLGGGVPLTLAYVSSYMLIIVELAAYDYWDENAGVCGTIGLGIAAAALAYGFIRPFVYSNNKKVTQVMDGFHFGIVPTANDGVGMNIGYSIKF